ncbi:right-handed parallel beta-helix repeat-containing protein [Paenibacillus sp. J5C_2022]|uniref:right-handed parallel beta-helix repeat-containing protein n=1 Tax=Paenibacillus sp. J5C2022 TaxID=2977129 RepID=UPI0021CEF94F|nr:right-handed parallel beta-helix repeat-containing protein [Paenibacillus sp. J5C2022]MCU6709614.1 right-handed parallel beta-helix repeat-containing protein [Paenibacillus sp. J5C2022]
MMETVMKVLINLLWMMQLAMWPQMLASGKEMSVKPLSFTAAIQQGLAALGASEPHGIGEPRGAANARWQGTPQQIDIGKWGIKNDGTSPKETTSGLNKALQWAHSTGIAAVTLPPGNYLIDKDSHIEMVSDIVFQLPDDAVLLKETNGKENYEIMVVGFGVSNVTIRGGVYRGDKDTHDYSGKDHPHSAGTHEGGHGIALRGANAVTIEGVKAEQFTGDGLFITGTGTLTKDLYENHFITGGIDGNGKPVEAAGKIRTKEPVSLEHDIFKQQGVFELSNAQQLNRSYDIYFYNGAGKLLEKLTDKKVRDIMTIPDGASSFHLVFNQPGYKKAYIEVWNRVVSSDVVVKDSEFAYNRRQGISVVGGDGILIVNNELHHMKGTMPQSGIDLEGGFGENGHRNSNIMIRSNQFHNNASYDLILYDGRDALVENNYMGSKGAIGLAVSEPFTGALIRNNHFDGTRIIAYHDVVFKDNRLNDGYTTLTGPNIVIDGMSLTNATLSIGASEPFGVRASDVNIRITNPEVEAGLSLWGKRIRLDRVTIEGVPKLRSVQGGIEPGSIINDLRVVGYNPKYGLALPPATYNRCYFEGAEGDSFGSAGISGEGKYLFSDCTFVSNKTAGANVAAGHANLDLTIKNSTFRLNGNTSAITIDAAKQLSLLNNSIIAESLTSDKVELIRLNNYWHREEPHDILQATITGNILETNIDAVGISTMYAGKDAPPYIVKDNELGIAKLQVKDNDLTE